MEIEELPLAALARRRAALGERVERPVLLAAGAPVARNYAGNPYPFRASSHFLYFAGAPLPGAWVLLEDGQMTLFVEPPGPDDALWHGPAPSAADLAEATGSRVEPLASLAGRVAGRGVLTVPAPDLATRAAQTALLGTSEVDEGLVAALVELRLVHDDAAQAELRRAAAATVAAHRAGMAATRRGLREWSVQAAMEAEIIGRGMTTAYGSIVTVHGEVLHNHAHHHPLADGDLLLADVGAESRGGWAADVTRTWPVSGRFSPTQRAIYEVVLAAQAAAIDAVRPGVRYREVHLTAAHALAEGLVGLGILRGDPAELVEDDVHALFFPHGVGHLLGLDVHDMEDLGEDRVGYAPGRRRSDRFGLRYLRLDRDLVPGMAVTVEPGFYQVPALLADPERTRVAGDRLDRGTLARFADVRGIRIEDDVLVTAGGREVLTAAAPKAPAEVEAAVRP